MVMRETGIGVKPSKRTCDDPDCPFHGTLSVRGKVLDGVVVSDKMAKTVVVERDYLHPVRKYMRYERRRSHIKAHMPPCMDIKVGDKVKIFECRPLSKSVAFVVVEKIGKEE